MSTLFPNDQISEWKHSIPKYLYIKLSLQNLIKSREFTAGQLLPAEKDLCAEYGASRLTIRKALDELVTEGYIYKIQGKGTYVREDALKTGDMSMVRSCSELIRSQGMAPTRKILAQQVVPCAPEVACRLMVAPGAPVFHYERVYYADDVAAIYADSFFNQALLPGIEQYDLRDNSIVSIILEKYGIKIFRGEREIKAVQAPHNIARQLDVPDNFPLLQVLDLKTCTINGKSTPLESLTFLYHTERIRYCPSV